jgi:hypothetical protein
LYKHKNIFGSFLSHTNPFLRPSRDGPYYVIGYGGRAGIHTGFRSITLVLYIRSLPNLATWFSCGRWRTLFILGSLGQGHRYYKYNFSQQGRFHMKTLVLYIGSLPNLTTWLPCGRGRTLFILGSLCQRSRSPLL